MPEFVGVTAVSDHLTAAQPLVQPEQLAHVTRLERTQAHVRALLRAGASRSPLSSPSASGGRARRRRTRTRTRTSCS